jgi:hypothetical protein
MKRYMMYSRNNNNGEQRNNFCCLLQGAITKLTLRKYVKLPNSCRDCGQKLVNTKTLQVIGTQQCVSSSGQSLSVDC